MKRRALHLVRFAVFVAAFGTAVAAAGVEAAETNFTISPPMLQFLGAALAVGMLWERLNRNVKNSDALSAQVGALVGESVKTNEHLHLLNGTVAESVKHIGELKADAKIQAADIVGLKGGKP